MSDLLSRRGTFKVSRELIEDNSESVTEVLKDVLIVNIENDFFTNSLIYKGYCKHFDLLDDDEEAPEYLAKIHTNNGKLINVTWHRQKEYTEKDVKAMLKEINKNFECIEKTNTEALNRVADGAIKDLQGVIKLNKGGGLNNANLK